MSQLNGQTAFIFLSLLVLFRSSADEMSPTVGRAICFMQSTIHVSASGRTILTDTSTIRPGHTSGHPWPSPVDTQH